MKKFQTMPCFMFLISLFFASNSIFAVNINIKNYNKNFLIFEDKLTFSHSFFDSFRESIDMVGEINSFSRISYDNDEVEFNHEYKVIYSYNESGQISEVEIFLADFLTGNLMLASRSFYHYQNGLLDYVYYVSYNNPSSFITQRFDYYYDDNNYVDFVRIFWGNTLDSVMDYTYSSEGLLLRVDYFDADYNYNVTSSQNYSTYLYNDQSLITQQNTYKYYPNSDDQLTYQSEYFYDEQGLKTSYISHLLTSNLQLIEEYVYDENNYLIRVDKSQINNNIVEDSGYTLITNDGSGNQIREDSFSIEDEITSYLTRDFLSIVSNSDSDLVPAYNLRNYPNPFNPQTTISFNILKAGFVSLTVYNILGQKVTSLINAFKETGDHQIVWKGLDDNGHDVASGVYLYRIQVGKESKTKKMILMK
ncbi:T9SS type A sorting domain-containing protein [bacterium]|nr:T9SS type A sorting domain-containing protein [bacterium]